MNARQLHAEIKRLKAENEKLTTLNDVLKRVIFERDNFKHSVFITLASGDIIKVRD